VIANLNTRVDEVAKTVSAGSDTKLTAQLMEKVNILTVRNQHLEQQLTTAQTKLEQLAQVTG
jgi:chaperonin cofactor prefoldin